MSVCVCVCKFLSCFAGKLCLRRVANKTRYKLHDAWLMRQPSVGRNLCCGKPRATNWRHGLRVTSCQPNQNVQLFSSATDCLYCLFNMCTVAWLSEQPVRASERQAVSQRVNNGFYWVMPLIWRRQHNNELIATALNSGACQFGPGCGISLTCHVSYARLLQRPRRDNERLY